MASLVKLGSGKQPPRAIEFKGLDGKRCRLRIGKILLADARAYKRHVEHLLNAKRLGQRPPDETIGWLGNVEDATRNKLAKFNLCKPVSASPTFDAMIADFLKRKRLEVKPSSIKRIEDTVRLLKLYMNTAVRVRKITTATARDWRGELLKAKLSEASIRTATRNVKTIFNDAIERGIIRKNPFKPLPSASVAAKKSRYITPAETTRLIDACPDWRWRLFIGLIRYAGLRCPSESHAVQWSDVDWERRTLTVRAPKTDTTRIVPIRPELMALLNDGYSMASENGTSMIELPTNNRHRQTRSIVAKAGVEPWNELFQHLRRCCRTQLLNERHPGHVVSRWMGHGEKVGDDHYTMMTDDMLNAVSHPVENPLRTTVPAAELKSGAKSGAERGRNGVKCSANRNLPFEDGDEKSHVSPDETRENVADYEVVGGGLEPPTHGFSVHCSTN